MTEEEFRAYLINHREWLEQTTGHELTMERIEEMVQAVQADKRETARIVKTMNLSEYINKNVDLITLDGERVSGKVTDFVCPEAHPEDAYFVMACNKSGKIKVFIRNVKVRSLALDSRAEHPQ